MRLGCALLIASTASCGLFPSLDDLSGDASSTNDAAANDVIVPDAQLDTSLDTSPTAACDAGLTACGNSCVNTSSTSTSCGACGHDCLGGSCTAGKCEPVMLSSHGGNDVVVDKGEAYWVSSGSASASKCSTSNCSGTYVLLASNQFGIDDVVVDSTNVYWNKSSSVMKCARAGCNSTPTSLVSGQATADGGVPSFDGIAVSSTTVFFPLGGSLLGCGTSGCGNSPTIVTSAGADDLAVDGTNLYGTTYSTLWKCPLGSCSNVTRTSFATNLTGAESIAVDATSAYFSFGSGIGKCALTGCGIAPTILASGLNDASDLVVDAANVYWTNPTNDTVHRCAINGCNNQPETIATGQNNAKGIALDSVAVYWTTSTSLARLAK